MENTIRPTCPTCQVEEDESTGLCPKCGVDLVFCVECEQFGYHAETCSQFERN